MSIKKIAFIFFVFLVIVFVAGYIAWRNQQNSAPQQAIQSNPSPQQQAWQEVYPGASFAKLVEIKGEPKKSDVVNGSGTANYAGTNQYWDTAVSVQKDTVFFIREHVFKPQNTSLQSRLSRLDEQPTRLYGHVSGSGQYVYVSPDEGVAFLANEQNDTVYEAWYFKPAPLAAILALPAFSGYSTDLNTVRGEGGH